MKVYKNLFNKISNIENLFSAWEEFKRGKRLKADVMAFEHNLEENIFDLYHELINRTYKHGPYSGFQICDPKQRQIHKAFVRDRVLHHAVFKIVNPIFECGFIPNSFSCRIGKGSHKGVEALQKILRKVSQNNTKLCYVLKCDVRKFFDSIDHEILISLLSKKIKDEDALRLLSEFIGSYKVEKSEIWRERERERESTFALCAKGIPIGNLTSQLFANVYMNEFDQFVKHTLKVKHYARYTDDFVIVSENYQYLVDSVQFIQIFLKSKLRLSLHPNKVEIRKYSQGIDFLGYVIFPHHKLMRKKTVKRIYRKLKEKASELKKGLISEESLDKSLKSYEGALSHANTHTLSEDIKNQLWFWLKS